MEGWEPMEDGRENKNPVLRIRVNDLTVIMTFSTNENGRLIRLTRWTDMSAGLSARYSAA